jgi:hypothetical protein
MVFDGYSRSFAFSCGVPLRGINQNMKTAVTSVLTEAAPKMTEELLAFVQ